MPIINLADVSLSKLCGYHDSVSPMSKYRLSQHAYNQSFQPFQPALTNHSHRLCLSLDCPEIRLLAHHLIPTPYFSLLHLSDKQKHAIAQQMPCWRAIKSPKHVRISLPNWPGPHNRKQYKTQLSQIFCTNTDLYINHNPSFGHIEYPHKNSSNCAQILWMCLNKYSYDNCALF